MKHISEYLDEGLREMFEERAAIMHFEGGLPKEKSEALARAECESYRIRKEAERIEMAGDA